MNFMAFPSQTPNRENLFYSIFLNLNPQCLLFNTKTQTIISHSNFFFLIADSSTHGIHLSLKQPIFHKNRTYGSVIIQMSLFNQLLELLPPAVV